MGSGKGRAATRKVKGGVVGLILDGRGRRPFSVPTDAKERIQKLNEWHRALGLYPERQAATV
jgi:hypothetical protein